MLKRVYYGCVFLFLLMLAACSPVRVLETEAAPGFDLQHYKSFDFFEFDASGDTTEDFGRNAGMIREAITQALEFRGLVHSTQQPDLLINIGVVVQEKVQTRETTIREAPRYIGQRRYSWKSEEIEVGRYRQGTLTLDLVDRSSNEMVWKGVAEGAIPEEDEKIRKRIDEAIDVLFRKL